MSLSSIGNIADAEVEQGSSDMRQLVIFQLGEGSYGLDIQFVREINRLSKVTPVPSAPGFIEGIINLRGTIVPVVNLGLRFGLSETARSKDSRIVVIESEGHTLGMVVDQVSEVLRLAADDVDPASNMTSSGIDVEFLEGVGKVGERLILLLNPNKLFTAEEKAQLQEIAEG